MGGSAETTLERVPYIRYLTIFQEKFVSDLLEYQNKANAIHTTFAKKLGLAIRPTDVGAQKIDDIMLDIYRIVVTAFSMTNKANQVRFFERPS